MKVLIRIDLSVYDIDTLTSLYSTKIITKSELIAELRERGHSEWAAIQMTRVG